MVLQVLDVVLAEEEREHPDEQGLLLVALQAVLQQLVNVEIYVRLEGRPFFVLLEDEVEDKLVSILVDPHIMEVSRVQGFGHAHLSGLRDLLPLRHCNEPGEYVVDEVIIVNWRMRNRSKADLLPNLSHREVPFMLLLVGLHHKVHLIAWSIVDNIKTILATFDAPGHFNLIL